MRKALKLYCMIPRTLQIKNFLSYGTHCAPISFDDHQLICLSGNNGHGKSALLDAITWAIWGCARKIQNSPRADQGLLRLGQTDMFVIFDCTIQSVTYRIKREFEIVYGKPKTTLDFGLLNEDNTVNSLTEKTIRDTQARINTIIGLDYETFINSSFLRQGNANEFSKRSPKERKEIISAILGLNTYDALKRAALERAKIAAQEVTTFSALLAHTRAEKESLTTLLATYPQFQSELNKLAEEMAECAAAQKRISQELAIHERNKGALVEETHAYNIKKSLYAQSLQELVATALLWRTTRARSADKGQYAKLRQQLDAAQREHAQAQQNFAAYYRTKDELQTIETNYTHTTHAITTRESEIKTEQRHLLERFAQTLQQLDEQTATLEAQKKTLLTEIETVQRTIDHATHTVTELIHKTAPISDLQKLFDKRKETYHRWTTLGNVVRDEQHAQLKRLELTQDLHNPSCPLCEQSLSAARKRFLQTKIELRVHIHAHQLERFKLILPLLKTRLIADHKALQLMTEQKTMVHTLEHTQQQDNLKLTQLTQLHTELIKKTTQLVEKKKEISAQLVALKKVAAQAPSSAELTALRAQLAETTQKLTTLKKTLDALAYNPTALETVTARIQQLKTALELYENHAHTTFAQQERALQISALVTKLKQEKQALAAYTKIDESLIAITKTIADLLSTRNSVLSSEEKLRALYANLLIRQGTYDAAHATCATAEKNSAELEQRITQAEAIAHDYQAIAAAVGKDGIQALLIEEAIPEIEEYANRLLATLTNNTAQIMIESLRDLKSGGTKETLDIKISDTQGVRPYEMFSGGEAFRIDIALRIAISKLLAHRAGTALQTLIIDEGFGSQDEDGLNAMIDVLHALQSEFAKIIVVSHLPVMKDQFPVHFVVEKGSQGSMVRVLEQG